MTTAQDLLRKDYISVDANDTVSQFIGKLRKAKMHSAVVFDDGKYMGVVDKRFLLTSRINPAEMKMRNIIKKRSKSKAQFFVPTLTPNSDIKEICKKMVSADTHNIPVMQNNKVIGVVSLHDLAKEIANNYRNLTCQELASMKLITVKPKDEIFKAINILERAGIDHLPVVDDKNEVIGMVAVADIIENSNFWGMSAQKISQAASHQKGKKTGYQHGEKTKMMNLPIENCMSRKSICCTSPATKIPEAIEMMEENDVCNVILMKGKNPIGILTIKDILLDYIK